MRAVIVDDEPLARALLRRLLAASPGVEIVGEAGDGDAAVATIAATAPDVVFLDVQLPGRDGFGVLEQLAAPPPAIVFVTAHDRYAIRAFEVHALDYLRKPFDEDRLAVAVARARDRLARPDPDALGRALALLAELRGGRGRLALRDGERTLLIALDEIERIVAAGKHVEVHVVGARGSACHVVRDSMTALERRLDPARFVRVHRSAIVNLDHIREIRPWFAGDQHLTLGSGATVTTGRGFRDRLLARLRR